jgi:hypothetical protein
MNTTDITAATLFARNCIREANRAASRAEHRLAAELREPAQLAVAEVNAAVARLRAVSPAERGELAFTLPIGLVRDASGVVTKVPDLEVQARIGLVFDTFLKRRTAVRVVRTLHERGLSLPRRDRDGQACWKRRTIPAVTHDAQESGLCRCLRLWQDPNGSEQRPRREDKAEAPFGRGMEDRREGQISSLCRLASAVSRASLRSSARSASNVSRRA